MKKNLGQFKKGYKVSKEVIEKRVKSRSGYSHSEETKEKMRKSARGFSLTARINQRIYAMSRNGEKIWNWKGDKAGEDAMHDWIRRKLGTPNYCEHCKKSNKKVYDWANIDHSYKRKIEDYIRLCRSCHRKYDIKNNGYKRERGVDGKFIN